MHSFFSWRFPMLLIFTNVYFSTGFAPAQDSLTIIALQARRFVYLRQQSQQPRPPHFLQSWILFQYINLCVVHKFQNLFSSFNLFKASGSRTAAAVATADFSCLSILDEIFKTGQLFYAIQLLVLTSFSYWCASSLSQAAIKWAADGLLFHPPRLLSALKKTSRWS